MTDELLGVEKAREFLRVAVGLDLPLWRFYEHARTGVFPAGLVVLREGKKIWFRRSGLEQWVARGGSTRAEAA